jgi:hypothetical protein
MEALQPRYLTDFGTAGEAVAFPARELKYEPWTGSLDLIVLLHSPCAYSPAFRGDFKTRDLEACAQLQLRLLVSEMSGVERPDGVWVITRD